ncbi:ribonuclease P [bacterium]|nr:ribonuclease P [bacterium]
MYFDLNIKGAGYENNIELASEALKYGWNHINFSYNQNDFLNALEFKEDLNSNFDGEIDIDYTLEIKSNNVSEIRKIVRKFRKKSSCISVIGGDLKVNRAVVENIQIDILSRPYLKRYDAGINQVLAKEAVQNNVAIELSFNDILKSYLTHRSKILSNFNDIYTLYRKFDFPLILSSGSKSVFDIKTPHDFKAFFIQSGLNESEVDKSFMTVSDILEFNKSRDKMILKGVRRVDDET